LLQRNDVQIPLVTSSLPHVNERIQAIVKDLPPADEKLRASLKRLREGFADAKPNAARGREIFAKTCATCHQIGGQGARIGPQLDGIGARGADRLLEDILDPNRNVDQTFRVTNLALADGRLVSGLLLREEGAVLVLADAQGQEIRVPKE